MLVLPCRIGLQVLMHCLGGNPRISQWCLELRVGLAFGLDQRMNHGNQFWLLLFGLGATTNREGVHTANPSPKFAKPGVHRIPSPAKHLFGSTRMPLTVLDRHFRLKLPSPKPR